MMTYLSHPLVELPDGVAETAVWPELAAPLGDEAGGVGPHERRWLSVATLHRSALYEDATLSTLVSRHCLSLIEGVGTAVLELEVQASISRTDPGLGLKQRNGEKARLVPLCRRALVDILEVADRARLGVGERYQLNHGQASRSLETVALQLLGWWSLQLPGRTIRELIQRIIAELAVDMDAGVNWRALFDETFGRLAPQFAESQSGPDHQAVFEVTVSTRDGRSGTGSAASKKAARQMACRDYLRRFSPGVHAPSPGETAPPAADALPVHVEDRRLATLFAVPDPTLFSRALTHSSWVFENTVHRDRRASNEVLANLGSSVLGVVAARARAVSLLSVSTRPDPELSTGLTVPDENLVALGDALGLRRASRLGAGQLRSGVSDEMLANFVQAVLAAAYMQVGTVPEFETRLPDVVADFLVEQGGRSTRDDATRLQMLAMELDLDWQFTDRQTGPDHAPSFLNTMRISGGGAAVVVEGNGPGRTAAKKAAAAVAMEAAALRGGVPVTVDRADVACFLLVRQLEILSSKPSRWGAWRQHNVLGAKYVAQRDWAGFDRWVEAVRRTGLLDRPASEAKSLEIYYQGAVQSSGTRPRFAESLSRVLRWIDSCLDDDRAILRPEPWHDLIALTAAHSVWLTPDGTADVATTLERWARPARRRSAVEIEIGGRADTDAQAAAAVDRILQELRGAASDAAPTLRARLTPGNSRHEIYLSPTTGRAQGGPASLISLVCEAAPGVTVVQEDSGTTLHVDARVTGSGWLWEAAACASQTDADDIELARLLHDLKNEVTGARAALGRPATARTERLGAARDASRHIDSASALAALLLDAEFLYQPAPAGSCELVEFLRGYCGELINRLPPEVRVIPPVTTPATVAVSSAVLRGTLDNLVKNAVEAIGDGGQIEFEYTLLEADGGVILEIRDTGPGLPEEVVTALRADGPVPSGKRYGSGLGLPGVMRMVRRAGGDLQPLRTTSGGAWLISLPLVEEAETTNG